MNWYERLKEHVEHVIGIDLARDSVSGTLIEVGEDYLVIRIDDWSNDQAMFADKTIRFEDVESYYHLREDCDQCMHNDVSVYLKDTWRKDRQ